MKLISKEAGIAAIQVVQDEVRPLSGYNVPAMLSGITQRYQFARSPSIDETNKSGAKFANGALPEKKILITELAVYGSSVSVTSIDTNDSKAVLDDLIVWLQKEFGYREPQTKPLLAYQSDVVVQFDADVDRALPQFAAIREFVEKAMESINGIKKPVQFNRIDFGSDPLISGPNAVFLIERRAGMAYSTNRYFSKAYLPSDAHLKALELLEKTFGGKSRG